MSAIAIRVLAPGDEAALEAFLAPRWRSAMFPRANARAGGLRDRGRAPEGTYVAAWRDRAIAAVAVHFWNGVLAVEAPEASLLPSVVQTAVATTGRRVRGFAGASWQVAAARAALGLEEEPPREREDLFVLALAELRPPPSLVDGAWRCRAPRAAERDRLAEWRADYAHDPSVRDRFALDDVMRVLDVGGAPVAFCTFLAQLPDVVLVGGVYTPPPLRGRGYGRAVVAGALAEAHGHGVTHALLFTADDNVAARRAYAAIGFAADTDVTLLTL